MHLFYEAAPFPGPTRRVRLENSLPPLWCRPPFPSRKASIPTSLWASPCLEAQHLSLPKCACAKDASVQGQGAYRIGLVFWAPQAGRSVWYLGLPSLPAAHLSPEASDNPGGASPIRPSSSPAGGGGEGGQIAAFSGSSPQGLSCPALTLWSAGASSFSQTSVLPTSPSLSPYPRLPL